MLEASVLLILHSNGISTVQYVGRCRLSAGDRRLFALLVSRSPDAALLRGDTLQLQYVSEQICWEQNTKPHCTLTSATSQLGGLMNHTAVRETCRHVNSKQVI